MTNGYIALISAILITLILITAALAVGLGGFWSRFNILGSEVKAGSTGLAEACLEHARLRLAEEDVYAGDDTIPVGEAECYIAPVAHCSSQKIVVTRGIYREAHTILRVELQNGTGDVLSFDEIPSFANPSCPP